MSTPGVVNFPISLDDLISLVEAANNARTSLSSTITAADLLIPVVQPSPFPGSGYVTIVDNPNSPTQIEIVLYTSKSGNNLVVPSGGRGAQATMAQAFNVGAVVLGNVTARSHTVQNDAIIAVEAKIGTGADTPGGGAQVFISDTIGTTNYRNLQTADVTNLDSSISNLQSQITSNDNELANSVVRKDLAGSQTIISNLEISNTSPIVNLKDSAATRNLRINLGSSNVHFILDHIAATPLLINTTNAVTTFSQIPILPAANPTLVDQAVRKGYVDSVDANLQSQITSNDNELANSVVRKDVTAQQTIISNLVVSKGGPTLSLIDSVSGKSYLATVTSAGKLVIGETGISNAIIIDPGTGLVTFQAVPLGPAANPTTPNQLTRKEYVDTRKTWWSLSWFIADPSTFPANSFSLVQKAGIPFTDGQPQTFTATEMWIFASSGANTGSFIIEMRKHPFNSQSLQTALGSIDFNPTLGANIGARVVNNITNHTFAAADYVYPILTAVSGPAQRDVTITLIGYQNPTS